MNKIISFGAMLTIAAGAVTFNSSCSSNDVPSYDPSAEKTALYQENFVKTFGNIDPKTIGDSDRTFHVHPNLQRV